MAPNVLYTTSSRDEKGDIKTRNIWTRTTKFRSASTVSANESASSVFRGPFVEIDFNFASLPTFHGSQKENQDEKKGVAVLKYRHTASWINDRDNGLYGSMGLRISRPLHKFHRAYNVKLIHRFFKSLRSLGRQWVKRGAYRYGWWLETEQRE